MKDTYGFRPMYTVGEETEAMREASYAVMNKNNPEYVKQRKSSSSNFDYKKSILSGLSSSSLDEAGNIASGIIIKGKNSGWQVFDDIGYYGIQKSIKSFTKSQVLVKKSLGLIGTVGFAYLSIRESLANKEYFGAVIDAGAAATGFVAGLGLSALETVAIAAGAPVVVVSVGIFIAGLGISVLIDKKASEIKK